jgi:general secretion pathway protein D
VLSRPQILTLDNQEATITVGEEVPFIRNTRVTDQGSTFNTIEYEDVGIILTVTPHINPNGWVILDVHPEISAISDSTVPIAEGVTAAVFTKREARTTVAVRDGQTIVIGGMMRDNMRDVVRSVPFLGRIPLLGGLFRFTDTVKEKTELLIFLTPYILKSEQELQRMSGEVLDRARLLPGTLDEHDRENKRLDPNRGKRTTVKTAGPKKDIDKKDTDKKSAAPDSAAPTEVGPPNPDDSTDAAPTPSP